RTGDGRGRINTPAHAEEGLSLAKARLEARTCPSMRVFARLSRPSGGAGWDYP
ncbi:MAG: hypothetical protein JWL74_453, partial [Alphaproteobacteria bacterium]|nr:hypothetical protein [Alphaproteobacteria bacterium]